MSIRKTYQNPRTGLISANKLKKKLKKENLKDIKYFIEKQESYQLHKDVKQKFKQILSRGVNENWQMDLMDMSKVGKISGNKGHNWLLNVVDVYSRHAWSVPIKRKSANLVNVALLEIISNVGKFPTNINHDDGNEFKGDVKRTLIKENVKQWISEKDDINKNAIVERFNRTLRGLLKRYWTMTGKHNFINVIDDLIYNYNHTTHGAFKDLYTPQEVYDGKHFNIFRRLEDNEKEIKEGDLVRLMIKKGVFSKSDDPKWSKEIYEVVERVKNRYKVRNSLGDIIKRKYKENELLVISGVDKVVLDSGEKKIEDKRRRVERRMNKEGLEVKNIVSGKRERKKKIIFDL